MFKPTYVFDKVGEITPDFLAKKHIKGLLLDLDNTLTTHNNPVPPQSSLDWLAKMKAAGIKLMIVSNNHAPRVKPFAEQLELDFVPEGKKPLTFGYTKAIAKLGLNKKNVAAVGDQIFTDVLGSNLKGIRSIFVFPIEPETSLPFRFKTLQAPGYLEAMGLDHYEYQCGRGVKVSDKIAFALKDKAKEHNITLSLHAPYFISLSSLEAEKRDNSINYILQSCDAASRMGADRIVIHSGSCAKISREDALELAKDTLTRARKAAVEQGFEHIVFCPETMGKVNQLGNLTEVLELCKLDDTFLPTIDFGHLNAREFGYIKGKAEYEKMLDEVENAIGHDRLKIFHSHFSKIMFTNPGGEKKHLTFDDNQGFGPDYEPLMEIVAKKDLSPIFVCESAGTQDKDALTMKNYYLSVK